MSNLPASKFDPAALNALEASARVLDLLAENLIDVGTPRELVRMPRHVIALCAEVRRAWAVNRYLASQLQDTRRVARAITAPREGEQ